MKILRTGIIRYNDFDQEDLYRFITYGGKDLYEEPVFSSVNNGIHLESLKKGKFKKSDITEEVSISFPANQKTYTSKGMFFIWDGKSKLEKNMDFIASVNNGIIVFSESPYYLPLSAILPKYNKNNSYNWSFVRVGNNPPKPIITVPETKTGWNNLKKAFTEFLIFLRLFVGIEFRIYFFESKTPDPNQKEFSEVPSFIPTALNLGYNIILAPIIQKQLHLKVSNAGKVYNVSFEERFKKYIAKKYPDLIMVKLGTGSAYINPRNIDKKVINEIRKHDGNPERLRTMLDWIVWGYENKKHILFSNDLDNALAMCHEVGHYLIDIEGGIGKNLQNNMKKGLHNESFIMFCGFILGILGPIGEIAGYLSSFFLKFPLLYTEFMASYKGLGVLKDAGGTKEEIEEAKKVFRAAWGTYLNRTIQTTIMSSLGRISGHLIKNKIK